MSSVIPHAFNADMHRAQLMNLPQYVASSDFLTICRWVSHRGHLLALVSDPNTPIEPVRSIIVGIISVDKAYLQPHGNFNPSFNDPWKAARAAKLSFTLQCPDNHPAFSEDWKPALDKLEGIQDQIASTQKKLHFFVNEPNRQRSLRFGFSLWEERTDENNTADRNAFTTAYSVTPECTPFWNKLKVTNHLIRLPVFDVDDSVILDPEAFADKLTGSLVELSFTFRHYYMAANASRPEANDTFTAPLESVSILAPAPVLLASPHKNVVHMRKPRHQPQTPSRSEHVNAAKAFVPVQNHFPQPQFVQGSSSQVTNQLGSSNDDNHLFSPTKDSEAKRSATDDNEESSGSPPRKRLANSERQAVVDSAIQKAEAERRAAEQKAIVDAAVAAAVSKAVAEALAAHMAATAGSAAAVTAQTTPAVPAPSSASAQQTIPTVPEGEEKRVGSDTETQNVGKDDSADGNNDETASTGGKAAGKRRSKNN
ncbi:hypothetical protein CPC08DRAFT_722886 [Agrocybe pediades]|nr:hypothetical protein CPC08DRAFT_722886 [Agrocybe pediades]